MNHAFIIGAPRCGTTTVHSWFEQNSEVLTSFPKETNYFRCEYHKGTQFYLDKYFSEERKISSHKVLLNVTPSLSWIGYCSKRMYETFPEAKIIYMVRNPLERIYSGWKIVHEMRHGREPDSFPEYISKNLPTANINKFDREGEYMKNIDVSGETYEPNAIEATMYYSQIRRFIEIGYKVELILLEDIVKSPFSVYKEICKVLEVFPNQVSLSEKNINDNWKQQPRNKLPSLSYKEINEKFPLESMLIKKVFLNEVVLLGEIFNRNLIKEWSL